MNDNGEKFTSSAAAWALVVALALLLLLLAMAVRLAGFAAVAVMR